MPQSKRFIVTTDGERPVKDVAKDLREKGFSVDQILDEIGCITGSADESTMEKVRKVRGVTDVSPEGEINIGPPDAPATW